MVSISRRTWTRLVIPAALLSFNMFIVWGMASHEYLGNMQTTDGNFIGMSRIFSEHFCFFSWWPFWNAGLPTQLEYAPLFPAICALASILTGWPAALAFHFVMGLFYSLAAVSVYVAECVLSKTWWKGLAAAMLYSLWSPIALLSPEVRREMGGLWNSRRIHTILFYGEVPHVAAVAVLPLALALLHLAWTRRQRRYHVLAGAAILATALINAIGAATVALAVIALLAAEPWRTQRYAVASLVPMTLVTYAIASPWFSPSFMRIVQKNQANIGRIYRIDLAWVTAAILLVAGFFALAWWLRRKVQAVDVRFGALVTLIFGGLTMVHYAANIDVLYQAHRYAHEMGVGVCLLIGSLIPAIRLKRIYLVAGAAAALCLIAVQARHLRKEVRELGPPIDITRTMEYRTAKFFDRTMHGRRVFAAGSSSLWLNTFTDTPQLSGGHEPTALNFYQRVAVFTLYSGENAGARDAEYSIVWLKAFGVHAIHVPGDNTTEPYKPFVHPRKFDGVLPVIWHEDGDTIYAVPQRSDSLSHVIPEQDVVWRHPRHGLDVGPMLPYVKALDDPALPLTREETPDFNHIRVDTQIPPHCVLVFQMNYHPGWRASIGGVRQQTFADGIGLLVVRPTCQGQCTIDMEFAGSTEYHVTETCAVIAVLGVFVWLLAPLRRRRTA